MGLAGFLIKDSKSLLKFGSKKSSSSSSSILSSVSSAASIGGQVGSLGLSAISFAGKEIYIIGSGVIGLIIFLLR
jgi:hypothetical protein